MATQVEERHRLWGAIHAHVRNGGGSINSQPGLFPIGLECSLESELPERLRGMGYKVVSCGTAERLLPKAEIVHLNAKVSVTREQLAPSVVEVWELSLPEGGPR